MTYKGETTGNYYVVKNGYQTMACIWVCFTCGEMFDSELSPIYTGECYECYPREMKEVDQP